MKKYEEYKNTNIEWIGKIPSHWKLLKFKFLVERIVAGLNPRDNFTLGEGRNYYVTIKNFKDNKLFLDEKCDKINDKALSIINKRSQLKVNDILFASIFKEPQIYRIKDEPKNWNINESVFSIRTKRSIIKSEFLQYVLISNYFYKPLKIGATGSTFQSVKIEHLKNNFTLLPPINEQISIVYYLDRKIQQIDSIIQKKKELIENLKEYRQSLITEVITKGLDKGVEMKDSGFEWVGEVPFHWSVKKMKHLSILITKGTTPTSLGKAFTDKGVNFLKIECIDDEYNIDLTKCSFIDEETNKLLSRSELKKNDLVLGIAGAIGRCAIVKSNYLPMNTNQAVGIIRCNLNKVIPKFLIYVISSANTKKYFELNVTQTAQANLNLEQVGNIIVPVPSLKEQEEIVYYLDENIKLVNCLLNKTKTNISLIEEYRQSLISETVTGKRKVDI